MTQTHPLYDKLLEEVKSGGEQEIDIKLLCKSITDIYKDLSPESAHKHYEEILALIYHHELSVNNGILLSTLFDGKSMAGGKGILYKMDSLPIILKNIIARYVDNWKE